MRYILFLLLITSIASAQDTMVFIKPIVVGTDSIKFRRDTYITPDSIYTLTRDTLAITVTPLPAPPDTSTRVYIGNALSRSATVTTAQDWFDSAIYLPVGSYYFEGNFRGIITGGTANFALRSSFSQRTTLVISVIEGIARGAKANVMANSTVNGGGSFNSLSILVVTASNNLRGGFYQISGFLTVTTAGSFMPTFSITADSGGTDCNIYTSFKITKIP